MYVFPANSTHTSSPSSATSQTLSNYRVPAGFLRLRMTILLLCYLMCYLKRPATALRPWFQRSDRRRISASSRCFRDASVASPVVPSAHRTTAAGRVHWRAFRPCPLFANWPELVSFRGMAVVVMHRAKQVVVDQLVVPLGNAGPFVRDTQAG